MKSTEPTLYSFVNADETVGYGGHVGTDSQNRLLLEIKGTGEIRAFHKHEVEEVFPFTFDILVGNGCVQSIYSYIGDPGKIRLGDFWVLNDSPQVGKIVAVNTKNRMASPSFSGAKLETSISIP